MVVVGGVFCALNCLEVHVGLCCQGAGAAIQRGHGPAPRAHVWGWMAVTGSFF